MWIRETLIQAVDTCLSSKVVSQNCETISPMAVDAVLGIIDPLNATNVDLRDIKVKRANTQQYTMSVGKKGSLGNATDECVRAAVG